MFNFGLLGVETIKFPLCGITIIKIRFYYCNTNAITIYHRAWGELPSIKLDEYNELQEKNQWKLKIKCNGAVINGVKQKEQYEKLKAYRDS